MVDDLREDPEKRAALDRRVRNTQAQATPRRAQPPTAREQLLAELHQQAAQEEAQALEVAPEVGLAGPLAAEQETTNDPADADADGPDVPQWGADDEPAPAAAPAATAAPERARVGQEHRDEHGHGDGLGGAEGEAQVGASSRRHDE